MWHQLRPSIKKLVEKLWGPGAEASAVLALFTFPPTNFVPVAIQVPITNNSTASKNWIAPITADLFILSPWLRSSESASPL